MLVMLLAVMLLASFGVAVAVGQTQAEELNELGLFNGTGVTEDGQPIFELERRLTRAEALVMVLRLMGLEKQALSCELDHPFVDASGWERRYVAYAYANGITNGVSHTEFRPEDYVSPQMFTSLVLRALGYSDMSETPDFAYADALSFGKKYRTY